MTDDPARRGDVSRRSLTGCCLVATPRMRDPMLAGAVIYLCVHSEQGSMGVVINRILEGFSFLGLLKELHLPLPERDPGIPVHFGGPAERQQGFALHTADYVRDDTVVLNPAMAFTATREALRDIAHGTGPRRALVALGYTGWPPGRLDEEVRDDQWLVMEADPDLVFAPDSDTKADLALARLGIDPARLSGEGGLA